MRFFDCETDIIQSDPRHNAFLWVFHIQQIFQMVTICLCTDRLF